MSKPKIAFIDDEERILRSLTMQFKMSHQVFSTTDPDEFLDIIRNQHIHVVISDQRMPKKLGVEILNEVREISPRSIRILLTGYADLNAVLGSINEGEIYRYITKPWDNTELKRTVARATEIALQLEATKDQPIALNTSATRESILVLDETGELYTEISGILKANYELVQAKTLEEAYEHLTSGKFGLAITDVNLGSENITLMIKALKQYTPDLVVIVMTTIKDSGMLIELINQGQIYRCLPKPIRNPSLLEMSVQRAFNHYHQLKAVPELALAHEVEQAEPVAEVTVSNRILGFVKRLRDRLANA